MPTLIRPKRKEQHRKPTGDQKFYHSLIWKKAREIKLRGCCVCEVHKAKGEYIDCTYNSPIDHIIGVIPWGGAKTDQRNLMTLCSSCHDRKSALELHRGLLCESTRNEQGELIPAEGGREFVISTILNTENL